MTEKLTAESRGNKKAFLTNQKGLLFEKVGVELKSDLSVPQIREMELAPYPHQHKLRSCMY